MTSDLEDIKGQIKAGDIEGARLSLDSFTASDPLNTSAWELFASISDDPNERAACYRHILQIDPDNRQVAGKLLEISGQIQDSSPQKRPAHGDDPALYCKQCCGRAEVHFVGDMHDKRAICSYCGTEVDLPDSYHRIQKLREHQRIPGGGDRTVERTVIETRRDGLPAAGNFESHPTDLQKIIQIMTDKGAAALNEDHIKTLRESGINLSFDPKILDPEIIQELQGKGFDIYADSPGSQYTKTVTTTTQERTGSIFKWPFFKGRKAVKKRKPLSLEELILLAGGPLPPEERLNCPNPRCGAVISKSASKCPWCGKSL